MRKRIIATTAALLLLSGLAACQRAETIPPVEATPVDETSATKAGDPAAAGVAENPAPPRGAANLFSIYGTGVKGVYLLVDRDTGCEWIGTSLSAQHQGSYGFTSIEPRMERSDSIGFRQRCRNR